MPESENLGSFFKENKQLAKDYLYTRGMIYKLKLIRIFSKSAGYFIWIIISLFLLSLFIIFLGFTLGFWLSEITGSYAKGFGLTSLVVLVVITVLAWLRKKLFVDPFIRKIINDADEEIEIKNEE